MSLLGAGSALRSIIGQAGPASRRCLTTKGIPPAFCFDIDGVLKQGEHVLPEAKEALQILVGNNKSNQPFPFLCVTNGGGYKEDIRSQKLTKELGVDIGLHQIVQSHTIFRPLAQKFGDKPVLVVGGFSDRCRKVAEGYGFKHSYIPADVVHWKHAVWPFQKLSPRELEYVKKDVDFSQIEFAAVLVFHDGTDWGRDIQLITDLVRAENGVFGTHKDLKNPDLWTAERQLPVYFSNPDLLWGNDFPQPRFGQGAFQTSVAAVYKETTGYNLHRIVGGKPSKKTYTYAASLLYSAIAAAREGHSDIDLHGKSKATFEGSVYMVGDNPASDIAGANAFGWESILVRTGVFRGKDETEAAHKPTVIKRNVLEGVRWALEREGFGHVLP